MLLASGASIPTITGAIEEEYANCEANCSHCNGYITDHTDLASDFDESEYRRELLNDVSPFSVVSINGRSLITHTMDFTESASMHPLISLLRATTSVN
jgi:hypothetical protein